MTKKEIEIGKEYMVKHAGKRVKVRVLATVESGFKRKMTHWRCLKLSTHREITIKSAAKFTPIIGVATHTPIEQVPE